MPTSRASRSRHTTTLPLILPASARPVDASLIIRGIRTVKDFEYEETIADINRKLAGVETILLFTEPELTSISSTIVRELLQYGKDVSDFLPEGMEVE